MEDERKDANLIYNNKENIRVIHYSLKNPSEFLPDTQIVNKQYDAKLREWCGDYKWKLIYRATEHEYSAESFHECCDNKGPTLIVIKSSRGWIFGGCTTQSWSGRGISIFFLSFIIIGVIKNGLNSFIFTLKNPHGVPPTQYMKKEDSKCAILCDPENGPIFGNNVISADIFIGNNCNEEDSCFINNNGNQQYNCNSDYKESLFVHTNKVNRANKFSVFDYEVFTLEDEKIELNFIACDKERMYSKTVDYSFNTPSKFLPDSQLVDEKYDDMIKNEARIDNYKMKLKYRASENTFEHTSAIFEKYCKNASQLTILIIKSSAGWLYKNNYFQPQSKSNQASI